MMHITKNRAANIQPRTLIIGKWHQNRYRVIKPLGTGSIGAVYLVQASCGLYALKIGFDKMSIISEVNTLRQLSSVQGQSLGPFFVEMDDWNGLTFYVMEYIRGQSVSSFIKQKGNEWIVVFMLQLLTELDKLHQQGYIFGDLKPDNLIVAGPSPKIRLLDVGGVTKIGRSVKEFTSFYDRAYWGAGSRKAEPSYDLFSLAMVFFHVAHPDVSFQKQDGMKQIERKLSIHPYLKRYRSVFNGAFRGLYTDARMMREALLMIDGSMRLHRQMSRAEQTKAKKRKRRKLVRFTFMMTFLFLLFLLYLHFKG